MTKFAPDLFSKDDVAVFIDGSYIHQVLQKLHFKINYPKFALAIRESVKRVYGLHYYVSVNSEDDSHERFVKFMDLLRYNGYLLHKKDVKSATTRNYRHRDSLEVDITTDIMHAIKVNSKLTTIILIANSSEFDYPLGKLRELGYYIVLIGVDPIKTTVLKDDTLKSAGAYRSDISTNPHLRSMCDLFIDFQEFFELFESIENTGLSIANLKDTKFVSPE